MDRTAIRTNGARGHVRSVDATKTGETPRRSDGKARQLMSKSTQILAAAAAAAAGLSVRGRTPCCRGPVQGRHRGLRQKSAAASTPSASLQYKSTWQSGDYSAQAIARGVTCCAICRALPRASRANAHNGYTRTAIRMRHTAQPNIHISCVRST